MWVHSFSKGALFFVFQIHVDISFFFFKETQKLNYKNSTFKQYTSKK